MEVNNWFWEEGKELEEVLLLNGYVEEGELVDYGSKGEFVCWLKGLWVGPVGCVDPAGWL